MCYRNVIIGLSFKTVPKTGFLVFGKKVLAFLGLSSVQWGARHVPFWGIRVFHKKVLPFSGGATEDFGPKWPKTAELFMRMSLFGPFLF
jgi:hypothetical protein